MPHAPPSKQNPSISWLIALLALISLVTILRLKLEPNPKAQTCSTTILFKFLRGGPLTVARRKPKLNCLKIGEHNFDLISVTTWTAMALLETVITSSVKFTTWIKMENLMIKNVRMPLKLSKM